MTSRTSLNLFPMKQSSGEDEKAERNPIGAPIGAKRPREHRERAAAAEGDTTSRLQSPDRSEVKSERSHCQNNVDNQNTWLNQVH